jgi:hypothetical protein
VWLLILLKLWVGGKFYKKKQKTKKIGKSNVSGVEGEARTGNGRAFFEYFKSN